MLNEIEIDVVIPVFNGERYIEEAITSVLSQSSLPKKLIVVYDGSTDNTRDIVEKLFQFYEGLVETVLYSQPNSGLSSARNSGIRLSQAPYIAFLDADDLWSPEKLKEQKKVFVDSEISNLGLVYCAYHHIDQNGDVFNELPIVPIHKDIRGDVFEKIQQFNLVVSSGSGVLIKRTCFEKVGCFDENLKAFEDWDMWLRISESFGFDYTETSLVKIRRHVDSMQADSAHMNRNALLFYKKWILKIDNVTALREWAFNIGKYVLKPTYSKEREREVRGFFSREELHKLYRKYNGSLRLYLSLKKIIG